MMLKDCGNLLPPSAKHKRYSTRVLELDLKDLVQILVLLLISYVTLGKPHQPYNLLFPYLLGAGQSAGEFSLTASICIPNHKAHSLTMKTENHMCLLIPASIQIWGHEKRNVAPSDTLISKTQTTLTYTQDILYLKFHTKSIMNSRQVA